MGRDNARHESLPLNIVLDTFMVHSDRCRMGGGTVAITGGSEVVEPELEGRLEVGTGLYYQHRS